jgi:hypothetical protein
VQHREVSAADLLLDVDNPRHASASNQRETIDLLLDGMSDKLIRLADDISKNGLSPIDELLVLQNRNGTYTVLEGNRRVAAIKLLSNPNLAAGRSIESELKKIAAGSNLPSSIRCAVATSREEAKHWQELRHTGQNEGAGVVPWNAESTQRFRRQKGSQADRAISFLDSVSKSYGRIGAITAPAKTVAANKLTTLGRLVSDPDVRSALGITFSDGEMLAHYKSSDLSPAIERVLTDLAGTLTVSDLKTKMQRKKYIAKIKDVLPQSDSYLPTARPLSEESSTLRRRARKITPAKLGSKPPDQLFSGVTVSNLGSKIQSILSELKRLDLSRFPNAASVLLRAVIELSVDQVFDAKGWTKVGKFKERVKKCLTTIDPTGRDPRFQPVLAGLQDGTSLMAVATMHAWVHNPHWHPTATELRQIAHNYSPFLSALDNMV